jgi:hypothetical protein
VDMTASLFVIPGTAEGGHAGGVYSGSHTVRRRVQGRMPHAHGCHLSSGLISCSCWWEAQELPEVHNIRVLCGHSGPEMLVFCFQETMLLQEEGAQALPKPIGD